MVIITNITSAFVSSGHYLILYIWFIWDKIDINLILALNKENSCILYAQLERRACRSFAFLFKPKPFANRIFISDYKTIDPILFFD